MASNPADQDAEREKSGERPFAEDEQCTGEQRPAKQRQRDEHHAHGSPHGNRFSQHAELVVSKAHVDGTRLGIAESADGSRARTHAIVPRHSGTPACTTWHESSCTLKPVCYNAETTSNKLSRKGLSVIRTGLLRTVTPGLCCDCRVGGRVVVRSVTRPARSTSTSAKSQSTAKTPAKSTTTARSTCQDRPPRRASTKRRSTTRVPPGEAGSGQGRGSGQGAGGSAGAQVQDGRERRGGSRLARRSRHHVQPGERRRALGVNSQNQRSIASITKVMTAVVFMEDSPDLERQVVVDRSRRAVRRRPPISRPAPR